tara:strand:- start:270 stop:473 length:204 start_codon:yes stop_codon:yes gene_type:complete
MVSTIKELIDVLTELPEDLQFFLTKDNEVIPAEIEVKTLMQKGDFTLTGVILNSVLSEEMQRLINNN